MRSVDANIILRLVLQDDEAQLAMAQQVLSSPCLILPTVLVEVVWTATRAKASSRVQIAQQLQALMELDHLRFVERDAVEWALDRYIKGGDFGDMLHVALSQGATHFTTFDSKVERYAQGGAVEIETLSVGYARIPS
jgi:predicted nucleic-acid-binding protein